MTVQAKHAELRIELRRAMSETRKWTLLPSLLDELDRLRLERKALCGPLPLAIPASPAPSGREDAPDGTSQHHALWIDRFAGTSR